MGSSDSTLPGKVQSVQGCQPPLSSRYSHSDGWFTHCEVSLRSENRTDGDDTWVPRVVIRVLNRYLGMTPTADADTNRHDPNGLRLALG